MSETTKAALLQQYEALKGFVDDDQQQVADCSMRLYQANVQLTRSKIRLAEMEQDLREMGAIVCQ